MAHYFKSTVHFKASDSSDYSDPLVFGYYEKERTTPVETQRFRITASTSGTTVTISTWTTIHSVIVKNLDTTNYVTMTWNSADQSSCDQRLLTGDWMKIPDVTAAGNLTFTANTADVLIEVVVSGV